MMLRMCQLLGQSTLSLSLSLSLSHVPLSSPLSPFALSPPFSPPPPLSYVHASLTSSILYVPYVSVSPLPLFPLISCSDMKVSDPELLGPDFARNGKEAITVRNLLLHNAGFPPDPKPNYCMYKLWVVLHKHTQGVYWLLIIERTF